MEKKYYVKRYDDTLAHAGKKGMKWGFNDGKKNGNRTAKEETYNGEQYLKEDSKVWKKVEGSEDGYGTYTHNNKEGGTDTLVKKKSDKLFGNTSSYSVSYGTTTNTKTVKEVGRLGQRIESAKSWVEELFKR